MYPSLASCSVAPKVNSQESCVDRADIFYGVSLLWKREANLCYWKENKRMEGRESTRQNGSVQLYPQIPAALATRVLRPTETHLGKGMSTEQGTASTVWRAAGR
jgi:hypothetical protein